MCACLGNWKGQLEPHSLCPFASSRPYAGANAVVLPERGRYRGVRSEGGAGARWKGERMCEESVRQAYEGARVQRDIDLTLCRTGAVGPPRHPLPLVGDFSRWLSTV